VSYTNMWILDNDLSRELPPIHYTASFIVLRWND